MRAMLKVLADCGNQGIVLTRWIPCVEENREALIARAREGEGFRGPGQSSIFNRQCSIIK